MIIDQVFKLFITPFVFLVLIGTLLLMFLILLPALIFKTGLRFMNFYKDKK